MRLRPSSLVFVSASIMASACHHARPGARAADAKVIARVAMDSAEIDRVCAHPDSVRAGLADCVLADQARPRPTNRFESPR